MIRFARSDAQRGAQTVEYALITIVAATVAALALAWARGGGIAGLFNTVLREAQSLFGIGG